MTDFTSATTHFEGCQDKEAYFKSTKSFVRSCKHAMICLVIMLGVLNEQGI